MRGERSKLKNRIDEFASTKARPTFSFFCLRLQYWASLKDYSNSLYLKFLILLFIMKFFVFYFFNMALKYFSLDTEFGWPFTLVLEVRASL